MHISPEPQIFSVQKKPSSPFCSLPFLPEVSAPCMYYATQGQRRGYQPIPVISPETESLSYRRHFTKCKQTPRHIPARLSVSPTLNPKGAFPLPSWSLSLSLSLYLLLRGWLLVWIFKIQQAEYTFKKALCSGFSSRQNLYPSLKIKSCCKL